MKNHQHTVAHCSNCMLVNDKETSSFYLQRLQPSKEKSAAEKGAENRSKESTWETFLL